MGLPDMGHLLSAHRLTGKTKALPTHARATPTHLVPFNLSLYPIFPLAIGAFADGQSRIVHFLRRPIWPQIAPVSSSPISAHRFPPIVHRKVSQRPERISPARTPVVPVVRCPGGGGTEGLEGTQDRPKALHKHATKILGTP